MSFTVCQSWNAKSRQSVDGAGEKNAEPNELVEHPDGAAAPVKDRFDYPSIVAFSLSICKGSVYSLTQIVEGIKQ